MEWDKRKAVKGSAIIEMWANTQATFWTEDWEESQIAVSLTEDINPDEWYEIDYDKGRIEIYPMEFLDTKEALEKYLFG